MISNSQSLCRTTGVNDEKRTKVKITPYFFTACQLLLHNHGQFLYLSRAVCIIPLYINV